MGVVTRVVEARDRMRSDPRDDGRAPDPSNTRACDPVADGAIMGPRCDGRAVVPVGVAATAVAAAWRGLVREQGTGDTWATQW